MQIKFNSHLIVVALCTFASSLYLGTTSSAQESEQQEFNSMQMTIIGDGDAPMVISSGSDGMMSGLGSMLSGIRAMGGNSLVMPAPDPFEMLSNANVRKDLELAKYQMDKVKAIQAEFQQQLTDQIGDISKGDLSAERFKDLPAMMAKLRDDRKEQLKLLLLPHQIDRLKQIALQTHIKQAGTANAISSEMVTDALSLSDDQKTQLKEKSVELKTKLEEDIKKLREQSKTELLSVLTSDQRKTLEELTGDKFEQKTQDWKDSFKGVRQRFRSQERMN